MAKVDLNKMVEQYQREEVTATELVEAVRKALGVEAFNRLMSELPLIKLPLYVPTKK